MCQGLSEISLPSPKRTLAAAVIAAVAAAARAHQIPHTYLHEPSGTVRPGFIVTDVRLQGECFVIMREHLNAKKGIDGCKQSDRQGGRGGASPTMRASPDFTALTWLKGAFLSLGPENASFAAAPADRRRVIHHARFCGA